VPIQISLLHKSGILLNRQLKTFTVEHMSHNIHSKNNRSFSSDLQSIYEKFLPLTEGHTTDILAHLKDADPNTFAISAVSIGGEVHSVGDFSKEIPIQSISKPFVYGMALKDWGEEHVRRIIGVEPTGDAFNSLIQHDQVCRGRFNPMVNAGAVTTTSLIKGGGLQERIQRIQEMISGYIGHPAEFDGAALSSRKNLDNMNRAIAYLMLSEGCIEGNVEETVELFAHQCSLSANCQDMAMMAATLANGGVQPFTGKRMVSARYVKNILSIMFSSGLYDFSGQWAYRVGIPAKSGLAGAVLAVVPGKMGLAAYSPLLGPHHKSVRGVRAIEEISRKYSFHVFGPSNCSCPSEKTRKIAAKKGAFEALLKDLWSKYREVDEGTVYNIEPGLHNVDHRHFGICAVTADGSVYETGDSRVNFFIQSVSKLFTYGLALEDHGRDAVLKRVDVEPTGDAYNAIIKVEESSKRPHNPMVNAGGIAVTSLIKGNGPAIRLNRILEMYGRYIGRKVFIDAPAFIAEQAANDRNRAISYLLKNFGMIEGEIQPTMDLYLQQCSAVINCLDLAMMGATLANDGVNPITGVQAVKSDYVRDLLTVMYTCGMYDFAGEWAYNVGIPAKSGVSGCVLGVVPGQMGIAVFSPPLDYRGNSMRGIKVFEELSQQLKLHIFHSPFPITSK
jgi:glutaminase